MNTHNNVNNTYTHVNATHISDTHISDTHISGTHISGTHRYIKRSFSQEEIRDTISDDMLFRRLRRVLSDDIKHEDGLYQYPTSINDINHHLSGKSHK